MAFLLEQSVEDERTGDEVLADRFAGGGHAYGLDEHITAHLHGNHHCEKERQDVALERM